MYATLLMVAVVALVGGGLLSWLFLWQGKSVGARPGEWAGGIAFVAVWIAATVHWLQDHDIDSEAPMSLPAFAREHPAVIVLSLCGVALWWLSRRVMSRQGNII